MNELIPFIRENLVLVIAFVIALIAYIYLELRTRGAAGVAVPNQQAVLLTNQKNSQIFDLRSQEEFKKGHIGNARFLESDDLKALPETLKKHQEHIILLTCQNGTKSTLAAAILRRKGFKNAYALQGGLTAWKKENMPITKN